MDTTLPKGSADALVAALELQLAFEHVDRHFFASDFSQHFLVPFLELLKFCLIDDHRAAHLCRLAKMFFEDMLGDCVARATNRCSNLLDTTSSCKRFIKAASCGVTW